MNYIYIDESGDLGMSEKGSEYFIITAVKLSEKENIKFLRIMKNIRKKILKKKLKNTSEIKFSNSTDQIRKKVLKKVIKLDLDIFSIVIKKELTNDKLKNNLPILYNYLIKILLEKCLKEINNDKLIICLDRCMSQKQRDNFEEYIKTQFFQLFERLPDVKITHEYSHNNQGLLVTDFICGSFGYKYNQKDNKYTEMITKKIIIEKNDLFK